MVELMVVLVIIGILVLLALPRLEPVVSKAKETEAKLMLKAVHTTFFMPMVLTAIRKWLTRYRMERT